MDARRGGVMVGDCWFDRVERSALVGCSTRSGENDGCDQSEEAKILKGEARHGCK